METYIYQAITSDGKEKKGSVNANNQDDAKHRIKELGLIPILVTKQNFFNKDIELSFTRKKIPVRELAIFCRQISSILKAGVSIVNALDMLEEQTENKLLKQGIIRARAGVEKGESLSESMREEDAFPNILIEMVRAGEASGSLEKSFDRMAIQFEKEARLKGIVKKAMMYPIILFIVMIGVLVVMLTFVIPNFMTMFEELDTDLPVSTKIVLGISNGVSSYWYVILIVIILLVIAYRFYKSTPNGRYNIDRFRLKMPILGKLRIKTACASIARTMSTLIQAGMPLIDAITIVSATMNNVLYKETLERIKNGVALGIPISSQMKSNALFLPMLVHMTGIGEETGKIDEMLSNCAVYYEEEVEITTGQLTSLLEPIIIVIMAILVVLLIIAIYEPMIQLYNSI